MDFRRTLPHWLMHHCTLGAILAALPAARGLAQPTTDPPQPTASAAIQPHHVLENFRHDASLTDVCFVNRTTGWAVGDRGVIWHTNDGGATWRQQASNVSCRLSSVFFLDARRGWAAGGEFLPHATASRGVILRTNDGGDTWTAVPHLMLPQLTRVKFFDGNRGIAVGGASSTQPSGVFVAHDGGDTWQPIATNRDGGWLTGDFLDQESGAVAGAAGRSAQLAGRQIVHPALNLHSLRSLRAMRLLSPTHGWVVGDGGLVLTTNDLGHSWQSPPTDLPTHASSQFDFHALAAIGAHVWIAGAPGTRIFHSPDSGQSWQTFPTGQLAPIRAIAFVDADHGWAVGDFGNILATIDGGRTWTSQRSGGQRAALLAIFAEPVNVPLEVIATLGAADGYLSAIDILHTREGEPASAGGQPAHPTLPDPERHHTALLLAGASTVSTAWRFPLPPNDLANTPAELLAALNRTSDGRAVEQIEQHLVRSIRMWRPDVIITGHTELDACEPRTAILAAVLRQSVDAAADPTCHSDLATDAGLAAWQVKKVYSLLPSKSRGAESIAANQFSPLLGASLNNFVSPARALIGPTDTSPPDRYDFDLLMSTLQNGSGSRGLFSGISLAAGSEARRPQSVLPVNDLEALRRMAERRRHLEALLERTEGNAAWAAQVGQITEGLSANDGAELLVQLADGYRSAGQLDLAADTYHLLARRYPDHPLSARSLEWLVQFYASSEMGHRLISRGSHNVRQASLELPAGEVASATGAPEHASPTIALSRDDRLHRATQLAEYLRSSKPALYAEPRVRFAEVAALRMLGFANPAKRYYLSLRQLPETNPWRRCGETESWFAKPVELPPPKTLGACRPAGQHPHLDGQFDEPFWNTADRLRLSGEDDQSTGTPPSEVRLAYDNDHLYVAIRCPKTPNLPSINSDRQARPRDADLSQNDRVTLRFDVDRDFTTAFELSVDSRGWTHDACWGDVHWNPTWYVAAASDEQTWTIEAAVPWSELVETPPAARHVWAVSACRTIPRVGHQNWAGPDSDSPDRFGFLLFE